MKKTTFFISLALAFSMISCNFIDISKKETGITAPNILINGDSIIVTPTTVASCAYINIFRYEVTDGTEAATVVENTTYNIGQIVKSEKYTASGELNFVDHYAEKGKYYQYFVRYRTNSGYLVSKTSSTWEGTAVAPYEKTIAVSGTELIIDYDSKEYSLKFKKADIVVPDTYEKDKNPSSEEVFNPMVAIDNGTRTQLFKLQEKTEKDPLDPSTEIDFYYLDMRSVLPENFFEKKLTIEGIVGQNTQEYKVSNSITDPTVLYTIYYWTLPLNAKDGAVEVIKINHISSDPEEKDIIIKNENSISDIYDYTKRETAESEPSTNVIYNFEKFGFLDSFYSF